MAQKLIYLDYNATTPVNPKVLEAMMPYFSEKFGNPASNHKMGWVAKEAVDQARDEIKTLINAQDERSIVFTSGATESNNLALRGFCEANPKKGKHIISQKTEHSSVLAPLKYLEKKGYEITYLDCDGVGRVDPEKVKNAIKGDTLLVSIMYANNEIGTIQPIAEIGKICREENIVFHCDAAQAVGKIPVDVQKDHIDILSASGHKLYAPKGIGFLYLCPKRPALRLQPLALGGGHEFGIRSGTLAVPLIIGLGKACALAHENSAKDSQKALRLRELLWQGLSENLDHLRRNSPKEHCLPGTLNLAFERIDGEALMMSLSEIAVTAGSACTSANTKPSHVLSALGYGEALAHISLRICIGCDTTQEEINRTIEIITDKVHKLRGISPALEKQTALGS